MAQTGYTPIQHYYSITGGNTPTTGNLTLGEIAINVADQKIYMLNSASNAVVTLVGTLGNQNANSVSITGGSVNGTTIGASTASTGAFTTISATGVITSTVSTGTAPFTVSSTTQVANLNAATAGTATNATNTAITDNTISSATWYPTIVSATTGNLPQTTSSTKLSFVPSTGTLTATNHAGTWAGNTITVPYGGTGLTSLTANYIPYGNGTGAFSSSANLTYNGTSLLVGYATAVSSEVLGVNGAIRNTSLIRTGNSPDDQSGISAQSYGVFAKTQVTASTDSVLLTLGDGTYPNSGYPRINFKGYYSGNAYTAFIKSGAGTDLEFGTYNNGTSMSLTAAGTLNLTSLGTGLVYSNGGTLTSTNPSDQNLKTNITTLPYGLNEINQLKPVSYTLVNDTINQGTQFGFVAQDVEKVVPAFTKLVTNINPVDNTTTSYLGLDREGINAAMCMAIQQLSAEIVTLQARLKAANIA